ncbi:hypothetical protein GCM10023238_00720 [Streptomyces heliomycini]
MRHPAALRAPGSGRVPVRPRAPYRPRPYPRRPGRARPRFPVPPRRTSGDHSHPGPPLPEDPPTDAATAWALAARGGDSDAVDRFVRALHRDVVRYVAHLCADPQTVDDLAQDTFLRALGSLHSVRGSLLARTWLLAIAAPRGWADSHRYTAGVTRHPDGRTCPTGGLTVERAQPRGLTRIRRRHRAARSAGPAAPGAARGVRPHPAAPDCRTPRRLALGDCPVGTVRSRVAARGRPSPPRRRGGGGEHGRTETVPDRG